MRWIGQHIYDLISRFRSDVYLEDIDTGTIASGGNLGLDSNNKIVKATISSGSGDITGVDLTGASPIGVNSETGTTSGDYSATITVDTATTTGRGVVELATTAETTTGTDTGRVVTPDGLKDGYQGSTNVTTLGTIGSGTWQGTAIASAYLDADTAHLSTQKHITHHSFTADIDTTKTYVGMGDADSESTGTTGIDMPLVFPVASKLLQVNLRSNKNLSGKTYTWRLETQATGVGFATGPTVVGTQSGSGPAQTGHTTYDFTTSLDSGDNVVDAFDAVYLSLQSDVATANTKYYITCVWEVNVSGY